MARGAQNTQNGGLTYLNFMAGKFVERVDENTTGAVERELKKGPNAGKVVHELNYDTYEGQIIDLKTESTEYGQKLNIFMDVSTVEEPDKKVKISLSLSSGPAKGFLSRLPVIDFAKDVCLKGFSILNKENGRTNTYLVPYQDGVKLESQFTKDNPNGLPQMKKVKIKGQEVWDDTDQLEFYEALIAKTFSGAVAPEAETKPAPKVEEETEDLPF